MENATSSEPVPTLEEQSTVSTVNSNSDVSSQVNQLTKAGRLQQYVEQWKCITSDVYILGIVSGFKIPFINPPVQKKEPSPIKFTLAEISHIDDEISKLLFTGAIKITQDEIGQFISSIFVVPKSSGGARLVINLKHLNEFVECPHFKMEDYRTAKYLIRKDMYMSVLDQKDAYHAIPMYEGHQKYLKFRWKNNLYKYTCLPFGLNIAPFIFTKLMKPVFSYLRDKGYLSVVFLDDCLLMGENYESCMENVTQTCTMYKKLGLQIHNEKSHLIPSQKVRFLGFVFDSTEYIFYLPNDKKLKILKYCKYIKENSTCTVRKLSELIGLFVSACPAVPYGTLYTKQLEFEKVLAFDKSKSYNSNITISSEGMSDINWWCNNLNKAKVALHDEFFNSVMFTDSSLSGWGGTYNGVPTKGTFHTKLQQSHINELELLAILFTLQSLCKERNIRILCRCDNTTAVAYVNNYGGCKSTKCHSIAKQIWTFCEQRNIFIFASYIHTSKNFIADSLSRMDSDSSDFMLNEKYFIQISDRFFMPEIDIFATNLSKKCETFYSWFPCPGSSGVDSFTIKWNDKFYAFPPFCLVARMLRKIISDRIFGVVVVPNWTSQPWYPIFKKLVVSEVLNFNNYDSLICPITNSLHNLSGNVRLVAAVVSGKCLKP